MSREGQPGPAGRGGKVRLDVLAASRGLYPSREKARAAILAGELTVDGLPAAKPGTPVSPDVALSTRKRPRFVSRGGEKLAGALDRFALDVSGLVALDAGASTGGFTDCLLQRGAAHVVAVDVGYGQLAWKLRRDPRVTVLERQNIRHLTAEKLRAALPAGTPLPDLATLDLSFIGLDKVFTPLVSLIRPGARVLALVKPQFQVGRGLVGRGGVVRRPELHRAAIVDAGRAARLAGLDVAGLTYSGLPGPRGNLEYFLLLELGGAGEGGPGREIDGLEKTRQHLDAEDLSHLAGEVVSTAHSALKDV